MIRVPRQIAGILSGLWGVGLAASTQVPLPWWAHYVIIAGGVVLAGLGIIPQVAEPASTPTTASLEQGPWS